MDATVLRLTGRVAAAVEALEAGSGRYGLVTARELAPAGVPKATVARLVAAGRWVRLERGVYAVGAWDEPLQRCAAALLAAGDRAVLHLWSAALALGGLDLDPPTTPHVAVPLDGSGRRWARRSIDPGSCTLAHGLPTTNAIQTLLDLADELDATRLEWALECALRERLLTIADLEAALVRPGRRDGAGASLLDEVLCLRPLGAPPTESLLETRFLQLVRSLDVPDPVRQHPVRTAIGRFRIDVAWPALGVFIELDGEGHKDQPTYDANRETAIVATTGWLCGRFGWRRVTRMPRATGRDVTALLAHAAQRPPMR